MRLNKIATPSEKRELLDCVCSNFTLTGKKLGFTMKKPFDSLAEGLHSGDWLPESDARQNEKGLLFEFPFGQLDAAKGEKRLLPQEMLDQAAGLAISPIERRARLDRIGLARQYDRLLRETPGLTRKDLAGRLGITSARLNQILGLLKGGPGR